MKQENVMEQQDIVLNVIKDIIQIIQQVLCVKNVIQIVLMIIVIQKMDNVLNVSMIIMLIHQTKEFVYHVILIVKKEIVME